MNDRTKVQGFTLLELLMVIIIIGILAALALPGYYRATERSRAAEATTMMGQIRGSIQRFCVENNGSLPPGFPDLDVENPNTAPSQAAGGTRQWDYAFPGTIACPSPAGPLTIGAFTATRVAGPCVGSTVTMIDPPTIVGGSIFGYTWQGPCA